MMTKRAAEVLVSHLGTCDVMEWVDNNPEHYLDHTVFRDKYGRILIASEYNPAQLDIEDDELGLSYWHPCPNGWERNNPLSYMWICRKNGRYIYITN